MSNLAPVVVQARLLRVLHRAFVQARNLALAGDCQQLYDLADTFELLQELMTHWDETTRGRIRSILAEWGNRDAARFGSQKLPKRAASLFLVFFSCFSGHGGR